MSCWPSARRPTDSVSAAARLAPPRGAPVPSVSEQMKVALLDDDPSHNDLVASVLDAAGFTCTSFTAPSRLLAELRKQTFDLIILDWNMPELSGVETLRLLREDPVTAPPVLLLTSRSVEADLVEGLNAGADDYIVKPLQPQVLLARVNAVVRRVHKAPSQPSSEQHGPYRLDAGAQTASWGGHVEALTPKEFQLASLLFNNLSRPLSREYLLRRIWGQRPDLETRTLDAHVSRLRAKLHLRPSNGFRLSTVYGFGYRLEACEPETGDGGE
ncbi:response regulator transcription factor [uncultured Caulobacter sp.]|uniref:response regulator transcription factor n=1 Tax=uncultured Caulobacter sp. TaxID=158749 RepID=UPI002612C740|nr:response regulator transcription factor [uncultured Caulobacter sp.]